MNDRKIKVLIAKPGLDGHDHGAKIVVRALLEAGLDVVYTGLRKTPEEVAQRAAEEDVDVIGLSSMAGSHMSFCQRLKPLLEERGLGNKLWIIGGVLPARDHDALYELGLDGIFPTGSSFEDIVGFITENAA